MNSQFEWTGWVNDSLLTCCQFQISHSVRQDQIYNWVYTGYSCIRLYHIITTIFCKQFLNETILFSLGFSVTGTTGKSVQEQIDKFSIIQSDSASPGSPILHHIQNFIKTEVSSFVLLWSLRGLNATLG